MSISQSTKGSPSDTARANSQRLNWANIYLSSNEKEQANLFFQQEDAFQSLVATVLSEGYSISFSFNEKTDSFICTVIGKSCVPANQGWGMTSHGGSFNTAFARAMFKMLWVGEGSSFAELSALHVAPET